MSYGAYRYVVLGLLAAYFMIGAALFVFSPALNEVYPFFSWTLFREVPQRDSIRYVVRVTAVNGVQLAQPVFLDQSEGIVKGGVGATNDSRISQLRSAVLEDDTDAIRTAREQLEETFLPRDVAYELVEIHFDPIDFWKTGAYSDMQPYRAFTSGTY